MYRLNTNICRYEHGNVTAGSEVSNKKVYFLNMYIASVEL